MEDKDHKNHSAYVNSCRYRSEHMALDKIIKSVKISARSRGLSSQNIIKTLLNLLLKNDIYLTIVLDDIQEGSDARNLLGDICRIDEFEIENIPQKSWKIY